MSLCSQCSQLDLQPYRIRKLPEDIAIDIDEAASESYFHRRVDVPSEFDIGDYADYKSSEEGGLNTRTEHRDFKQAMLEQRSKEQTSKSNEIIERSKTCDLCKLISDKIMKDGISTDNNIQISTKAFCDTIDKKQQHRGTVRLHINVLSDQVNTITGPLEAYQIAALTGKEDRCITEFQECSDPIPTTDDKECSQIQRHSEGLRDLRFSGRLVHPRASLSLLTKWIKLCGLTHGEQCGRPIFDAGSTPKLQSLLLIDVEQMCLVKAPTKCRYITLSYCWGTSWMLKHTMDNSANLHRNGALAKFQTPATISDAMTLARGLGERYLWVDALCIVQDDQHSKTIQLAQMGLIYSLSAFTIVAASGDDASAGLPGVRPGSRQINQSILRVGDKILLEVIGGQDYINGLEESAWNTRAWTMQEKMLSKKLLIFTKHQIYWKCWNAVWYEEVALEEVLDLSFHYIPLTTGPFSGTLRNFRDRKITYEILVNEYRKRQLTYQSDILHAFSGLCQVIGMIRHETFHWGLPSSQFERQLCWNMRGKGARNYASSVVDEHSVPFPSWSWAAWHGTHSGTWITWPAELPASSYSSDILIFSHGAQTGLIQINSESTDLEEDKMPVATILQGEASLDVRKQWKGEPQIIQAVHIPPTIDIGHLYFWTSTARLLVRQEGKQYPTGNSTFIYRNKILWLDPSAQSSVGDYDSDELGTMSLNLPNHLNFEEVEKRQDETGYFIEKPTGESQSYSILTIDFVILYAYAEELVSRYVYQLSALAVEWKDGVAYRIGCAKFPERVWVDIPEREWRLVVLG